MADIKLDVKFANKFYGTFKNERDEGRIGLQQDGFAPYELLFAALASCFYATMRDILKKRNMEYDGVDIHISGHKLTEGVPQYLEYAKIEVTYRGMAEDDHTFAKKAVDLASKYCSIFQTLAKVAEMETEVKFED